MALMALKTLVRLITMRNLNGTVRARILNGDRAECEHFGMAGGVAMWGPERAGLKLKEHE